MFVFIELILIIIEGGNSSARAYVVWLLIHFVKGMIISYWIFVESEVKGRFFRFIR